ncbi:Virginiamycin B lyase [Pseudocercospora fuligena]|uniref:Virginiamycin B lyase n=1 Tax=Pseudocercospora fuligena TaxID=685502 RepID=A0A8H6VFL0_9PEZI|nr:Virginiamycin B lyase [Pseudocercospora fuligena]
MKSYIANAALLAAAAYASPVERQASKFTYYNLTTPLASPCDLTTGQDGKIYADTFTANKIVQIDRSTGKLTEYDIPYKLPVLGDSVLPSDVQGRVTGACVVQPGKNGKIYAATGIRNEFAIFDPTDNSVTVLETGNPLGNLQPFNDAWPGETGMFFSQTTGNVINLIDYKTNAIKTWNVPTPLAGPLGMIVASDGNLWFVEMLANKMARLNPTTGKIDEFPLPLTLATPTVMRAETEGRYLWFTALATNSLGRFDIKTMTAKAFPLPQLLATPIEDTVDSKGNIWFSTLLRNSLNYLTPSTGKFTEIKQPDEDVSLVPSILPDLPPAADIAMHYEPSDNTMWFTEFVNNRIGKYQI